MSTMPFFFSLGLKIHEVQILVMFTFREQCLPLLPTAPSLNKQHINTMDRDAVQTCGWLDPTS